MVDGRMAGPAHDRMITPAGFAQLRAEMDKLWRVERPRVTQEVAEAAALGDRSENAEYIYGKKRLREIDKRLGWLSKRLESLEVVHVRPSADGRVAFGATVVAEDEEGVTHRWRLVGADEADPQQGTISVASPVAKALLGKRVDDDIEIRRPRGDLWVTIVAIEWES